MTRGKRKAIAAPAAVVPRVRLAREAAEAAPVPAETAAPGPAAPARQAPPARRRRTRFVF